MAPFPSCVPILTTLPWLPECTHVCAKPQPEPFSSSFPFLFVPLYFCSTLLFLPRRLLLLLLLANSHARLKVKVNCHHRFLLLYHNTSVLIYIPKDLSFFLLPFWSLSPDWQLHKIAETIFSFSFFFKSPKPSNMSKIEEVVKFTKQLKQSPVQDFLLNHNHASLILPLWLSTLLVYCLPKVYEMKIDFKT